jgi:hypothetical protein
MSTPSNARDHDRALVCFDFDITLTHEHIFKLISRMIEGGARRDHACLRAAQLLERVGPRGGAALWDALYALLSAGHGVAVTSFTCFPELPMTLLAHGVRELRARGASRELTGWLSRPIVIYGDPNPELRPPFKLAGAHLARVPPDRFEVVGKVTHMELARARAEEERGIRFERMILVDDDEVNVRRALEAGHSAVSVSADITQSDHISALRATLGV